MLKFSELLSEEKATKEDFGSLDKNEKGVLHELLTGFHLLGGRHMKKHENIQGESPQEAHDRIKKLLTPEQYNNFSERSRKAAQDILRERGFKPEDLADVQWTSKPGDIQRATGIDSSQREDDSDIMLSHKDGTHHGVSLKVSDDTKPITLSNNGLKSTYGGEKIFGNHIESLKRDYPEMGDVTSNPTLLQAARNRIVSKAAARGVHLSPDQVKVKSSDARKAWLESNPEAKKDIKARTTTMLNSITENMHNELSKLSPQELADHLRNKVLHAYKTPKEELGQGHTHMRHFTGGGLDASFDSKKPGEDYEHFLANPERIRMTRKGSSITYHYHDPETDRLIPFAMQTSKAGSQSDPTSSAVMIGKDVENKKDIADKERIKNRYLAARGSQVQQAPIQQKPTPMQIASQRVAAKKPVAQAPAPTKDAFSGTDSPVAGWTGSANPRQESESGPSNSMFGKSFHAAHELE
jgi:hypothetical protein